MSTALVLPSSMLRLALRADALVSGAAALLHLAGGGPLAAALGLPASLVWGSGVFIAAYAAALVVLARAARLHRALIALVVFGNLGWSAACVALALGAPWPLTAWGEAWLLAQALAVAALAAWQGAGWRASPVQAPALSTVRTA